MLFYSAAKAHYQQKCSAARVALPPRCRGPPALFMGCESSVLRHDVCYDVCSRSTGTATRSRNIDLRWGGDDLEVQISHQLRSGAIIDYTPEGALQLASRAVATISYVPDIW